MTKKVAYLLVSLTLLFATFLIHVLRFIPFVGFDYLIMLGVIAVYVYMIVKVHGKELSLDKFLFFSYYILASGLFLKFFANLGVLPKITFLVIISTLAYLIQLGLNVYIITERRSESIPLIQPARTVVFMGLAVTVFLATTIIYKILWFESTPIINSGIKIMLFGGFFYTLFRSLGWFLTNEGVGGGVGRSEHAIALEYDTIWRLSRFAGINLTQISVALMFFPLEDFSRGVFLASLMYIMINAIHAYLGHKVTWRLGFESLLIATFSYILVIFL